MHLSSLNVYIYIAFSNRTINKYIDTHAIIGRHARMMTDLLLVQVGQTRF